MMNSKTLTEQIPYRRVVWVTGFIKTTLSGSLIATGVTLIFSCLTDHPLFHGWNELGLALGLLAIILAILIIYTIDKWKENKKKEELEAINKHIDERAIEIAEEKILEAMNNIDQ